MERFSETEFAVVDVETTGLSHRGGDRIIEVAVLKLKGMAETGRYEALGGDPAFFDGRGSQAPAGDPGKNDRCGT